jgi:protocatechuate 3,4-dioxygenase alpha subunit
MLIHTTTRCYFDDEAANADDAILQQNVPSGRRPTLIATRQPDVDGAPSYRFDIVLQGDDETVFFDV